MQICKISKQLNTLRISKNNQTRRRTLVFSSDVTHRSHDHPTWVDWWRAGVGKWRRRGSVLILLAPTYCPWFRVKRLSDAVNVSIRTVGLRRLPECTCTHEQTDRHEKESRKKNVPNTILPQEKSNWGIYRTEYVILNGPKARLRFPLSHQHSQQSITLPLWPDHLHRRDRGRR